MLSTILVPLDGSSLAEHALPFAERLAQAAGARVLLSRVVPTFSVPETETEAGVLTSAQMYLDTIATRLTDSGIAVDVVVLHGDPAAEILAATHTRSASLVVMSTHGRSGFGRWLYGSVADNVIRTSSVPVILVTPGLVEAWPTDRRPRILLPLDGSPLAEAALAPAVEFAKQLGAELLLVDVVTWPPIMYADQVDVAPYDPEAQLADARDYLDQVASKLHGSGISVRYLADVGQTATETIIRVARDERADLIAMATHGRSNLARVVLGSTTTGTLQHTCVPLLVVRPTNVSHVPASAIKERSLVGV